MKIVFGGSFNPPTIAHQKIISELSKIYDEVILVPNGSGYERKNLDNYNHRVNMLRLITKDLNNITISDIEQTRKFNGTYLTLRDLDHPVFACGDDCLKDLHTWKESKTLLEENTFLIFTRNLNKEQIFQFIKKDSFLSKYENKFDVLEIDYPDIASKDFRNSLKTSVVTNDVLNYIEQNQLYKEDKMFNNYIKIALASPIVHLGRPMDNAKEIIEILNNDNKASIIVFPEMSVTGYNVGDKLFDNQFLLETKQALQYIIDNSNEKLLIVGCPIEFDGNLYNCACVIKNKEILGIIPKNTLENSMIKSESRYFNNRDSIQTNNLLHINDNLICGIGSYTFMDNSTNVKFAVEVGNDNVCDNSVDFIINISTNPFIIDNNNDIPTIAKAKSIKHSCAYLVTTTNASETSSDMLYETLQCAYVNGDILLEQQSTELDAMINYVDVDIEYIKNVKYKNLNPVLSNDTITFYSPNLIYLPNNFKLEQLPKKCPFVFEDESKCLQIINATASSLKKRLDHIGIKKVVIGISGGLDSTLTLLFAHYTFKKYKMDPKNIIAITMPGLGTGSKSKSIARNLMEKLGVASKEISIKKEALNHLKLIGHDIEQKDITYENVQARIRTLVLMSTANKEGAVVIGTGDMSEIALGWSTFGGDQMSMYNLNSGLPKTTIKKMVEYFAKIEPSVKIELKKVCSATISPELTGSDQATEDKIGKYEINDFIMYHMLLRGASKSRIIYLLKEVFNLEENAASSYYDNFVKRFNSNQFKRLTGAEGIKIFRLSLGARYDFKYPGDIK